MFDMPEFNPSENLNDLRTEYTSPEDLVKDLLTYAGEDAHLFSYNEFSYGEPIGPFEGDRAERIFFDFNVSQASADLLYSAWQDVEQGQYDAELAQTATRIDTTEAQLKEVLAATLAVESYKHQVWILEQQGEVLLAASPAKEDVEVFLETLKLLPERFPLVDDTGKGILPMDGRSTNDLLWDLSASSLKINDQTYNDITPSTAIDSLLRAQNIMRRECLSAYVDWEKIEKDTKMFGAKGAML